VVQTTLTNEALQTEYNGINFPSSVEKMLQNTSVQQLEGGNPINDLSSGRLVTRLMELNITFKPQLKDKKTEGSVFFQ
jgi:hypothetical protein